MSRIVGIDLGTTNSCIAIYENGAVRIIETEDGKKTVSSAVFYGDNGEIIVGQEAMRRSALSPTKVVYDAKRLIGCEFSNKNIQANLKTWSFNVVEGKNNNTEILLTNSKDVVRLRPEQVSAQVLRALKENGERDLKEKITNAVITVPAYFTNSQKEATKKAAKIAGLNVVRLIAEPTAAALAFTFGHEKEHSTVLVYDLGGGTFDISLIKLSGTEIEVITIDGDRFLGGRDFDKKLLNYVLRLIEEKYGVEISGPRKRRLLRRMEHQCERLKEVLSATTLATFELYEASELSEVELPITRKNFEDVNRELFINTLDILDNMLANVNVNKNTIDEVVLVGGSTRIPKIRQMVKDYFDGKEPNKTVNPDEVVAIGAAYQAALLSDHPSQKSKNYAITDIAPHSLGIEVVIKQGGSKNNMDVIIEKNQKIPCIVDKVYETAFDFQESTAIRIYEGENHRVEANVLLGEFIIDGITPKKQGEVKFIIKFQLDRDGILHINATESSKNITKYLTIRLVNRN